MLKKLPKCTIFREKIYVIVEIRKSGMSSADYILAVCALKKKLKEAYNANILQIWNIM